MAKHSRRMQTCFSILPTEKKNELNINEIQKKKSAEEKNGMFSIYRQQIQIWFVFQKFMYDS